MLAFKKFFWETKKKSGRGYEKCSVN